jgi:hypothetical protein
MGVKFLVLYQACATERPAAHVSNPRVIVTTQGLEGRQA